MAAFAKGTTVSVAKSRQEIEQLVTRYGATSFTSGWEQGRAAITFKAKGRHVRFILPLPDANDPAFLKGKRGVHTLAQREAAKEAEDRRRWRALALILKARLEAVASGIESFDEAFLSNIVVPGGQTMGEWAGPKLAAAYENGMNMPPMLGSGS